MAYRLASRLYPRAIALAILLFGTGVTSAGPPLAERETAQRVFETRVVDEGLRGVEPMDWNTQEISIEQVVDRLSEHNLFLSQDQLHPGAGETVTPLPQNLPQKRHGNGQVC
jgi:hypothetical protein